VKVLLDSNIIISAFATRGICCDIFEICLSEHQIILSEFMLKEIKRSLERKIKIPSKLSNEIVKFLSEEAKIVKPVKIQGKPCRDPDDIKILATAIAGEVDVIVTGDEDLLILKKFKKIPILSPKEFWKFLKKKKK